MLKRARFYTRRILGGYSVEEHLKLCNFSHNATRLSPRVKSDPDLKFSGPVSGSPEHIEWFKKVLYGDPLLRDVLADGQLTAVNELEYTTVPKKWDIDRGIMPNTTIGSYYTSGLGKIIRRRLKDFGLNLRHRPDVHRRLACINSKTRRLVTADLSSASDSFMSCVINALLPREWFNVLKFGRLNRFLFKDEFFSLTSFMTMGIGFTFELQSLLFYAILLALRDLTHAEGEISVYGDDLIYPRCMHGIVVQTFQDIGFTINKEKTFVDELFRESCGGDYYDGCPVRPFQPKGRAHELASLPAQSFLYKTMNGLLERFDRVEIPGTVLYLENCLASYGAILQVPSDFPEYSGVRTNCLISDTRYAQPTVGVVRTYSHRTSEERAKGIVGRVLSTSQTMSFHSLSESSGLRRVRFVLPYLWSNLQTMGLIEDDLTCFKWGNSPPCLRWLKRKVNRTIRGKKVTMYVYQAFVPKRAGTAFQVVKNQIPSWVAGHYNGLNDGFYSNR